MSQLIADTFFIVSRSMRGYRGIVRQYSNGYMIRGFVCNTVRETQEQAMNDAKNKLSKLTHTLASSLK